MIASHPAPKQLSPDTYRITGNELRQGDYSALLIHSITGYAGIHKGRVQYYGKIANYFISLKFDSGQGLEPLKNS